MRVPIQVSDGPPVCVFWDLVQVLPSLLRLNFREPLPADGGDVVEDGTGNCDIAGSVWSNPQILQTLEPVGIVAKRHFKL